MSAGEGASITLSVPFKSAPIYCFFDFFGITGFGPSGFARGSIPLPFATRICLLSGVNRTEVGYQPTGMKPSERLLPRSLTSIIAKLLLSALATSNTLPSDESARLLGVLPLG